MPLALQSVCRCKPLSCKLQAMASAASSYEHTGSQAHVYRSSALSVTRASPHPVAIHSTTQLLSTIGWSGRGRVSLKVGVASTTASAMGVRRRRWSEH